MEVSPITPAMAHTIRMVSAGVRTARDIPFIDVMVPKRCTGVNSSDFDEGARLCWMGLLTCAHGDDISLAISMKSENLSTAYVGM